MKTYPKIETIKFSSFPEYLYFDDHKITADYLLVLL